MPPRRRSHVSHDLTILWVILIGAFLVLVVVGSSAFFAVRWLMRPAFAEIEHAEPANPAPLPFPPPERPPVQPPPPAVPPQYELPDPTLRAPFAVDPALKALPGGTLYLSDMQEFGVTDGPMGWRFAKHGALGNSYAPQNTIIVDGRVPLKGLSTHPPFTGMLRVAYALDGRCKSIHGTVALSEDEGQFALGGPVRFVIMGDGKVLWGSEPIGGNQRRNQKFDVPLSGISTLELRAYVPNGSVTGAHAVWVDPYVALK
jgi:hypothetical protein